MKQMHFAPQLRFLCDRQGQVRMDFIGRQESMTADFDEVCRRLGVEARLEAVNVTCAPVDECAFDMRTVDRIRRIYERDYQLLGY